MPEIGTTPSAPLRSGARPALAGAALALVTIAVSSLLARSAAAELHAILLAIIGAIYVGFALVDADRDHLVPEIAGAAGFALLAVLGLWLTPWTLVAGLALHGVWDLMHHDGVRLLRTRTPGWYIPMCLAYDVPLAVWIAFDLLA